MEIETALLYQHERDLSQIIQIAIKRNRNLKDYPILSRIIQVRNNFRELLKEHGYKGNF